MPTYIVQLQDLTVDQAKIADAAVRQLVRHLRPHGANTGHNYALASQERRINTSVDAGKVFLVVGQGYVWLPKLSGTWY